MMQLSSLRIATKLLVAIAIPFFALLGLTGYVLIEKWSERAEMVRLDELAAGVGDVSRLIHEMQQILIDDVPYIIPYYSGVIEAWRTDTFTGWLENDPSFGLDAPESLVNLRPAQ